MMRYWLVLLLLANALLWAWGQGWLGGRSSGEQREPERLQAQVHPERLKLLPPAQAEALRRAPPLCRMLGPFADEAAWRSAEAALRSELNLPAGQWRHETRELSAQWAVASRQSSDAADLERKRGVLERAQLKARAMNLPGEEQPSLLVARFDSEAAAQAEASRLREGKGLRALRVLELRPAQTQHWLRVSAWPAERLKAQHASWGAGLQVCAGASAVAAAASAASEPALAASAASPASTPTSAARASD
jgi:hypothetical protein